MKTSRSERCGFPFSPVAEKLNFSLNPPERVEVFVWLCYNVIKYTIMER